MLFSESTYQFFYALSAGMILLPYLLSAAYFAKVAFTEADSFKGKLGVPVLVWRVFAVLGVIYSVFLAWASGAVGRYTYVYPVCSWHLAIYQGQEGA